MASPLPPTPGEVFGGLEDSREAWEDSREEGREVSKERRGGDHLKICVGLSRVWPPYPVITCVERDTLLDLDFFDIRRSFGLAEPCRFFLPSGD